MRKSWPRGPFGDEAEALGDRAAELCLLVASKHLGFARLRLVAFALVGFATVGSAKMA